MKNIHFLYTLLYGAVVFLFFGLAYPHHLHYQEEYQLFLFDSTYVWDVVRLPGGISDLLGRFFTQFFLFAWVGSLIIAVMLSIVQLLMLRLADWGRMYGLSYVPSCMLWIFLLDENALLGGAWSVLLMLLASWGCDKLHNVWVRRVTLVIAVPALYWIAGPVCLLFFLLQTKGHRLSSWYNAIFLALVIMPLLLSSLLPVQSHSLWYGIHYYRYPTTFPAMLWLASLSAFILPFIARKFQHWSATSSNCIITLISFALVMVCMGGIVWKSCNLKAEKVMKYDFMASHQQWNRILETIDKEKPNNQIGVTVQNLALAMRGILLQSIFGYNQNGMMGLLPDIQRDATSPMPTAEAFYQLGMVNAAQRTVFEAQEAILDFQKSARCYKRLAQTNLINGDYEVARKYLTALQKTLFYRDWANETLLLLDDEKAIDRHPEYGRLRKMLCKKDFYFSDHITPDALENLYLSNKNNKLAFQYMMAAFIFTGDKESFMHYAPKNR